MRPKIIITLIALLVGMVVAAIGQETYIRGDGFVQEVFTPNNVDHKLPSPAQSARPKAGPTMPVQYTPTEIQQLKLQVRQKDAQLAQVALREAQSNFQQKVKELMEEGVQVQKSQGWPDNVTLNADTLQFAAPPEVAKKEPSKP